MKDNLDDGLPPVCESKDPLNVKIGDIVLFDIEKTIAHFRNCGYTREHSDRIMDRINIRSRIKVVDVDYKFGIIRIPISDLEMTYTMPISLIKTILRN